ncbi:RNA-binding protein 42, partial [Tanacetum coccineum]
VRLCILDADSMVVRDKRTGKTNGYGFVSFANPTDLATALKEMNALFSQKSNSCSPKPTFVSGLLRRKLCLRHQLVASGGFGPGKAPQSGSSIKSRATLACPANGGVT